MIPELRAFLASSKFRPLLTGVLLLVAFTFRYVNVKLFDLQYDERITQGVVDNILRGDLRNNWAEICRRSLPVSSRPL